MARVQAPELPGIDPSWIRRVDEGWFPHLVLEATSHQLSVLAVIDFDHPDYPRKQPWPLVDGVVEVGLLGEDGLMADPLERIPLAEVSAIRDRVAAGDLSDFDVEGWGL